jgi:hypothetical protein
MEKHKANDAATCFVDKIMRRGKPLYPDLMNGKCCVLWGQKSELNLEGECCYSIKEGVSN